MTPRGTSSQACFQRNWKTAMVVSSVMPTMPISIPWRYMTCQ